MGAGNERPRANQQLPFSHVCPEVEDGKADKVINTLQFVRIVRKSAGSKGEGVKKKKKLYQLNKS